MRGSSHLNLMGIHCPLNPLRFWTRPLHVQLRSFRSVEKGSKQIILIVTNMQMLFTGCCLRHARFDKTSSLQIPQPAPVTCWHPVSPADRSIGLCKLRFLKIDQLGQAWAPVDYCRFFGISKYLSSELSAFYELLLQNHQPTTRSVPLLKQVFFSLMCVVD